MPDLRALAAEVDAALVAAGVEQRVLVVGSSPEDASDLDLLVGPAGEQALDRWLPSAGFAPWHGAWMRLQGALTAVVELDPAAGWQLPGEELRRLHEDAVPLPGLRLVAEPSPAHALLVLARRLRDNDGALDVRRLARARRALVAEPDALERARLLAPAWGCAGSLEVLAARVAGRTPAPQEVSDLLARDGLDVSDWRRTARRALTPLRRARPRRGAVVAVCGLDGAGKTTQTTLLADGLTSLGYEPVVLWDRIAYDRVLLRLAAPARTALRLAARRHGSGAPPALTPASGEQPASEQPSPALLVWSLVVTLVHVLTAGPRTRRHVRCGRVVIRDRYVLDALVHLRDRYGSAMPVQLHALLLRGLLPRPTAAFFLDVPAEQAHRRKPEQYDVERLARQRGLYHQHADALGVVTLDGTTPVPELSERVVRTVLDQLVRRRTSRA